MVVQQFCKGCEQYRCDVATRYLLRFACIIACQNSMVGVAAFDCPCTVAFLLMVARAIVSALQEADYEVCLDEGCSCCLICLDPAEEVDGDASVNCVRCSPCLLCEKAIVCTYKLQAREFGECHHTVGASWIRKDASRGSADFLG